MKTASETLEETLKRLNASSGTTFPASLFRSKKSGQVLYLEAGKDFVDTLLSFLLLPLGTIIRMLAAGIQVTPALGGLLYIYESVQNFFASDLQLAKQNLVQPRPAAIGCNCKCSGLPVQIALEKALILPSPRLPEEYYRCSDCYSLAPTYKGASCAHCNSRRYPSSTYSGGPSSVFFKEPDRHAAGFVKVNTPFIVTDSLQIMPLTTIQSAVRASEVGHDGEDDLEEDCLGISGRDSAALEHMRRHHISGQFFRSKTSGQVLYLKAGKNFVDMLFSFLLLPIGTIIHVLSKGVPQEQHYHGAKINIFKSIMEKLDSELLHVDRGSILAPPTPAANNPSDLIKAPASTGLPQLWQDADAAKRPSPPKKKFNPPEQFYMCRNCTRLSNTKGARCFNCWPQNGPSIANCYFGQGPCSLSAEEVQRLHDLVAEQQPVEECIRATGVGFVKENITIMVTDKLEIMPSTTIEIMSVLKEMKVNTLTDFESEKITVTITQVLQLIGSALTSNSCLNEVFGTGENSIKSST